MRGKEKNPPIMHLSGPHSEHKKKFNAPNIQRRTRILNWTLRVGC